MLYHVDKSFPDARADIEALESADPEFATLLAEFEELSRWLASIDQAASQDNKEVRDAVELRRDLEDEIRRSLEGYRDT